MAVHGRHNQAVICTKELVLAQALAFELRLLYEVFRKAVHCLPHVVQLQLRSKSWYAHVFNQLAYLQCLGYVGTN